MGSTLFHAPCLTDHHLTFGGVTSGGVSGRMKPELSGLHVVFLVDCRDEELRMILPVGLVLPLEAASGPVI